MTRKKEVFDALAYGTFVDLADFIIEKIPIVGTMVAVGVNEYTDDGTIAAPHVAMMIKGDGHYVDNGEQKVLFNEVVQVMNAMSEADDGKRFDVERTPGLLLSIESDDCDYGYMVVIVKIPAGVQADAIVFDETSLIREMVTLVDADLPAFTDMTIEDGANPNTEYVEYESDPRVHLVYGTLTNPKAAYDLDCSNLYIEE